MTPRSPHAAALPRVRGGTPASGISRRARGALRGDPRNIGQQRLAERRQRHVHTRHLEGRHRILLLICRSRPIFMPSRTDAIGPRWNPPYRLAHKIYQRRRRSDGNPRSTRGSPCPGDRWGHRGCTRRHTGSVRVRLGVAGWKLHRSGRAVIDDRPTRRSTSPSTTNQRTIGEPTTRYGRGNGPNLMLLHQKL